MIRIFPFVLLLAFCAPLADAQTVSGSIANGTVRRGTTARGSVVLEIPKELHVNSNRPGSEYLIPTEVALFAKGARVSRVVYPRGHDRRFQFTTKTLNVYEGKVSFPFRITVPRNYRGKLVTVTAIVDFQACSEEVCYPPRKETVNIEASVR
jgi:DsbC/DsbD-like thiol-disulfide interchange protein